MNVLSGALPAADILPAVADALDIGVVMLDEEARIVLWNAWMARHAGIAAEQTLGRPLAEALPGIASPRVGEAVSYALARKLPSVLSPALQKTPVLPLYSVPADRQADRRMHHLVHVIPLELAGRRLCLLQVSDTNAAVMRERLLRQQAEALRRAQNQDALSGVANRAFFDEALAREFERARQGGGRLALCLIDLDLFRDYNASHGERAGDACLAALGGLLRDVLPGPEALAARYGGDEFALLLPGAGEDDACALAVELRRRCAGEKPMPTLSIGMSVFMAGASAGTDVDTLQAGADIALYHAKQEGRDRAVLFSLADGNFRECDGADQAAP